jgi:zeta-carotene desaturase
MKKCLIIGSGISGLTAASVLSSKKIKVTVLEATPKPGGRTYSFKDSVTGDIIDNGQHILMGCYDYTLNFLRLIGAEKNFIHQKQLKLVFLDQDKSESRIEASDWFYPLNIISAFLKYDKLNYYERLNFFGLIIKLPFISKRDLNYKTVYEWLKKEKQSDNCIQSFWEILCVGALNTTSKNASALIFYNILVKIFFGGVSASKIVLPRYGLSESLIQPAINFIKNHSGELHTSENVRELVTANDKIAAVKTDKNIFNDFNFVISSVPLYALEKIISKDQLEIKSEFIYPTILNIHVWVKENKLSEEFYGLLNSRLHWIFNKDNHINIVVSDADELSVKTNDEIIQLVKEELNKYCGIDSDYILRYKIIKEKRATFLPDIKSNFNRPKTATKFKNLFLAGDWIDTGLPATIESAAKSGYLAAECILQNLN